jgi:hypothetical protein
MCLDFEVIEKKWLDCLVQVKKAVLKERSALLKDLAR